MSSWRQPDVPDVLSIDPVLLFSLDRSMDAVLVLLGISLMQRLHGYATRDGLRILLGFKSGHLAGALHELRDAQLIAERREGRVRQLLVATLDADHREALEAPLRPRLADAVPKDLDGGASVVKRAHDAHRSRTEAALLRKQQRTKEDPTETARREAREERKAKARERMARRRGAVGVVEPSTAVVDPPARSARIRTVTRTPRHEAP